jgi:hypothetical protein
MFRLQRLLLLAVTAVSAQLVHADPMEIYCTIRDSGGSLNCQVLGKVRKAMNADDIANFVDQGQVAAFVTLKSRKGMERTFQIDNKAPQYKRLAEIKKTASISEIGRAKADLFAEIEKKLIKLSDEMDGQAATAELVMYDPSITYDKNKREFKPLMDELEGYRKNREKVCTSTPAFEQVSRANSRLQTTLSNIIYAFQSPDSCMAGYKVFKDKDGAVDLRQLDKVADEFKMNCKKK